MSSRIILYLLLQVGYCTEGVQSDPDTAQLVGLLGYVETFKVFHDARLSGVPVLC